MTLHACIGLLCDVCVQADLQELSRIRFLRMTCPTQDGNLTPEEFVAAMSLPSVDLYLRYLEMLG